MTSRQPDLLVIVSDQHAQRFAGCYGDGLGATPNLDRLAAQGVTFDNAYCASPVCLPSRMSLLTGRYPHRHGCWNNDDALPSDELTYAHALGAGGYCPELVGRMHMVGPDQLHGFATRPIGDHNSDWPGLPGVAHGPLAGTAGPHVVSLLRSGVGRGAYEIKDEVVAAVAVDRLKEIAAARRAGDQRPFCLTLGLMLPHPPYVVNRDDFEFFPPEAGTPELTAPPAESLHPELAEWRAVTLIDEADPQAMRRARRAYYGLVRKMDRMIGTVLDTLSAEGLADDTLVVYTSDHGDHAGDRGLFWKHTFYDESAKVPLILSWPGRLPAGERRDAVVSLVDLAPTLAEAGGAPALPGIDGRSLLAVARGQAAPWTDEIFSEYCVDPGQVFAGNRYVMQRMIRSGRRKLVWYDGAPPQLFDLESDPQELVDRADDPQYRAVVEQLTARILADWDPAAVRRRLEERLARKELWVRWAKHVRPADAYRWDVPAGERIWVDDHAA